ncbi:hypothetical protein P43SY_001156 [Pythium insidiosum]|uniref:Uncharacterized protein n=1 Tax=Pythium insidiosum TaxID=114742 RepID=A0AAD5Q3Z3_PYTIN|nr:hypothetical protein P43SY_001156 [Pythium insidiosum]
MEPYEPSLRKRMLKPRFVKAHSIDFIHFEAYVNWELHESAPLSGDPPFVDVVHEGLEILEDGDYDVWITPHSLEHIVSLDDVFIGPSKTNFEFLFPMQPREPPPQREPFTLRVVKAQSIGVLNPEMYVSWEIMNSSSSSSLLDAPFVRMVKGGLVFLEDGDYEVHVGPSSTPFIVSLDDAFVEPLKAFSWHYKIRGSSGSVMRRHFTCGREYSV